MKTTTLRICSQCGQPGNGKPLAFTLTITASAPIGKRPETLRRWFCSMSCILTYFGRPL